VFAEQHTEVEQAAVLPAAPSQHGTEDGHEKVTHYLKKN